MATNQSVLILDKKTVEIDGVSAVKALDEDTVILESTLGIISVEGHELKIENFEKATAKILVSGNISGVFYLGNAVKKKGRGMIR